MIGGIRRVSIVLLAMAALASGSLTLPAHAQGSWLDAPLTNWNRPSMAIPAAPPANASSNDAFCAAEQRPPETPQDNALVAAGWRLFGSYQGGWDIMIVGGQSDEDGMCRPAGYNYFVFVSGRFAGTVSPTTMDSRTDGAAGLPSIGDSTTLYVTFTRYTASDPLCCPSSSTDVSYGLEGSRGAPALVPESASTTPNTP